LFHQRRAGTAELRGPVQRDITGIIEPLMVLEQTVPSRIVTDIEQACRRAAGFAAAAEYFTASLLQP
jgi:hypothetical protein